MRSLAMASLVTLGIMAGRRVVSLRGLGLAARVGPLGVRLSSDRMVQGAPPWVQPSPPDETLR